jgi:DNA-binding transcriptional MerR regulator
MMDQEEILIGELARRTNSKVPTIRYYEQIGLLSPPRRSAGNHRLYGPQHEARLGFIRHSRELGFSQHAIRELLDLSDVPERSCEAIDEIAREHLNEVNLRVDRLTRLKAELERMINQCAGGNVTKCRIIETLAEPSHALCLDNHR